MREGRRQERGSDIEREGWGRKRRGEKHAIVGLDRVINSRRACAARVTVCLSVCLRLYNIILALQATRRLMSDINSFSATWA